MLAYGILMRAACARAMENASLRAGSCWASGCLLAVGPERATKAEVRGRTRTIIVPMFTSGGTLPQIFRTAAGTMV